MAAPRLSDEQKAALVERYQAGAAAAELAVAYGCSAATVTRVVKAALPPAEYERLKQERGRGTSRSGVAAPAAAETPPLAEADLSPAAGPNDPGPAGQDDPEPQGGVLAIDDADDFGDDFGDEGDDAAMAEDDAGEAFVTLPVVPLEVVPELVECRPLEQATLPASAYLLVDKTVELEPRPLGELPELGQLPPEEQEQRALVLFANQRQAKQLCGRSQRVIKLPDPWVLHRTARYLVAQGITRVVLEGGVYSLPGS